VRDGRRDTMGLFDRKPQDSRERSTDERERERAERAARRAAREGLDPAGAAPPPLETPPPAPPPLETLPAPETPPVPETPPPAPPPLLRPPLETPPLETPPPAPPPSNPAPAPAPRTAQPPPAPVPRGVDAPSLVLDDEPVEDWSALDEPSARARLARRLHPPRGAPADRGPASGGGARRRRRIALVVAVAGGVLAVSAAWFAISLFQPLHGNDAARVAVVIPRGAGVSQAAGILARGGVISSAFFFKLRAKLDGATGIKPGRYLLPTDASYAFVLAALVAGPPPPPTIFVTITEGRTREAVDRLLHGSSLRGSYLAATRSSPVLRPQRYGAPRSVHTLEGFLFPATYKVPAGAPVSVLVAKQLRTFRQRFAGIDLRYARGHHLSPYDVLIIASMIEREAALDRERPLVAAVIYNRLRQGITLGIDATIRYAIGNFTSPLTVSELAIDSPYNTRTHQGLPPTPIGNPGLKSIAAAAHPAAVGYLYYVVKPGACNEHAFSSTADQFARDQARYNAARAAHGGNSPTTCH
jgi:uncharacterized YceG family protein